MGLEASAIGQGFSRGNLGAVAWWSASRSQSALVLLLSEGRQLTEAHIPAARPLPGARPHDGGRGQKRTPETGPGAKVKSAPGCKAEQTDEPEDKAQTPNEGYTVGSHSMQDSGTAILNAAAQVRMIVINEAATRLQIPADPLKAEGGVLIADDGRRLGYGELVSNEILHVRAEPHSDLLDQPATLSNTARLVEAQYRRAYQMHGSIGPSCAVGLFANGALTIWTHSQGVYPLRNASTMGASPRKLRRGRQLGVKGLSSRPRSLVMDIQPSAWPSVCWPRLGSALSNVTAAVILNQVAA
jgi:hypothetical protein